MMMASEADHKFSLDDKVTDFKAQLQAKFGTEKSPANMFFIYDPYEEKEDPKAKTEAAYDQVGETAHLPGDLERAAKVMKAIGYTDEEILVAGNDAYNFQGVNNPHLHANLLEGETVLDLGSGLGVDSFIAAHKVGKSGKVVGLDISKGEIKHAEARAKQRELENVSFVHADMEKMSLESSSIDCVISNGAYCMAPNKKAAFLEVLRVLKPGGRFSISTSVMKVDVDQADGKQWPICMRMFIHIDKL
jgi:SAM-dependent methyltransferase